MVMLVGKALSDVGYRYEALVHSIKVSAHQAKPSQFILNQLLFQERLWSFKRSQNDIKFLDIITIFQNAYCKLRFSRLSSTTWSEEGQCSHSSAAGACPIKSPHKHET